jgi:alcohol dehydrogenase class IV
MSNIEKAQILLKEFKGESYIYGPGVLGKAGEVAVKLGQRAVLVRNTFPGSSRFERTIEDSLKTAGVSLVAVVEGAQPNAPREDLARITEALVEFQPDVIISFGGGSTIDAVKSAEVLRTLGGKIEDYFGTGLVSKKLVETGTKLTPHIAIQTASSSAAHLTKYSNITDVHTGQKKLVVDDAIIPQYPLFDYETTYNAPLGLTSDGAMDGISHALEVLYGALGKSYYPQMERVAEVGISLVVEYLPQVIKNPTNPEFREALALATDLGGYSIMLGGTNGGHLTSFSLVDILSHGRACTIMNPYYTVFFAPAIEKPLRLIGKIFKNSGYIAVNLDSLRGRELGVGVAEGLIAFGRSIGFPVTLADVPGFNDSYIHNALVAAKDPQLKMKLENMPVPMTAETVDEFMGPILLAAKTGDLSLIKNV